jgi:hypothetical protein
MDLTVDRVNDALALTECDALAIRFCHSTLAQAFVDSQAPDQRPFAECARSRVCFRAFSVLFALAEGLTRLQHPALRLGIAVINLGRFLARVTGQLAAVGRT